VALLAKHSCNLDRKLTWTAQRYTTCSWRLHYVTVEFWISSR